MKVKKLGMSKYKGQDRNSGLFEANMIASHLSEIESKDTIVVINGLYDDCDKEWFESIKGKKRIVFVLTDISCLEKNKELIEYSDLVLTQTIEEIKDIKCRQTYGYVPELFYEDRKIARNQSNVCVFGGANTGREDLFKKYIYNSNGDLNDRIIAICKEYNEDGTIKYDDRLDYNSFISLVSFCKYSLVIARKEYNELGWVTSRFVESVSNNCLPVCDVLYDKYKHFGKKVVVDAYYELVDLMDFYNLHENFRIAMLNTFRERLEKDKYKFVKIIKEEVNKNGKQYFL